MAPPAGLLDRDPAPEALQAPSRRRSASYLAELIEKLLALLWQICLFGIPLGRFQ